MDSSYALPCVTTIAEQLDSLAATNKEIDVFFTEISGGWATIDTAPSKKLYTRLKMMMETAIAVEAAEMMASAAANAAADAAMKVALRAAAEEREREDEARRLEEQKAREKAERDKIEAEQAAEAAERAAELAAKAAARNKRKSLAEAAAEELQGHDPSLASKLPYNGNIQRAMVEQVAKFKLIRIAHRLPMRPRPEPLQTSDEHSSHIAHCLTLVASTLRRSPVPCAMYPLHLYCPRYRTAKQLITSKIRCEKGSSRRRSRQQQWSRQKRRHRHTRVPSMGTIGSNSLD